MCNRQRRVVCLEEAKCHLTHVLLSTSDEFKKLDPSGAECVGFLQSPWRAIVRNSAQYKAAEDGEEGDLKRTGIIPHMNNRFSARLKVARSRRTAGAGHAAAARRRGEHQGRSRVGRVFSQRSRTGGSRGEKRTRQGCKTNQGK